MADKAIMFGTPMIHALTAGRKTQTRRLLAAEAPQNATSAGVTSNSRDGQLDAWEWLSGDPTDMDTWGCEGSFKSGYRPGDRIWVKEAWRTWAGYDGERPSELPDNPPIFYEADRDNCDRHGRLRNPRFMCRYMSRFTLTIEDVRVQRLHEISEADCIAEGARVKGWASFGEFNSLNGVMVHTDQPAVYATPRCWYRQLWDDIHADVKWDDDPWVVALTFTVAIGNIDR